MLNQTGTTSAGSSHPPTLQSVNRSAALAILGSCMQTHSDFGQLRRSLITATTAPALSRSEPRLGVFLLPMPMQAFIDTASPCRRCDSGLRAHPDFPPPPLCVVAVVRVPLLLRSAQLLLLLRAKHARSLP